MNRRRLLILAIGIAAAGAVLWRLRPAPGTPEHAAARPVTSSHPTYAGTDTCAACHEDAYKAWRRSQHRNAMQPADQTSVKGRFDGGQFRYGSVVSTFFQRDGRYQVRTDGPDGKLADFEVKYTFGIYPLQQYLIELPGGRVQALSIAWDTRPKIAGGQRWFHLYPDERIAHGDELHWTGRQQNWNFMCADCHSTNLQKNYEAASGRFGTSWTEIDVACEACHGPGSQHVSWARQATSSGPRPADNGLTAQLTERRQVAWTINPATMMPVRSTARTTSREIDTCAQCHSRRSQIADGYAAGASLHDFYEPATLESSLYYPDGQQRGEVYTYGSFLQSKMAQAGVTCSDCHDPHTATLRASGNALCLRCHAALRYDAPAHHRHKPQSAGAQCVECHMPARTYMEIDPRRDHSLRVPRPDLTVTMNVPNACSRCHGDRSAVWAAEAVKGWLGRDASGFQDFATAFHDAEQQRSNAVASLLTIATSDREPPIVRASAFARLSEFGAPVSAVARGLRDADPLVRRSALRSLDAVPPLERMPSIMPLLADPIRSVRLAAARLLAPTASRLGNDDRAAFERVAAEVTAAARFNADRPEARVSFGVFLADLGRTREADQEYRAAIRIGPEFAPGYVNLAELLRTTASEADAEGVLRHGLTRNPKSPELHYALGLSLTRSRRAADAAAALKQASDLAPQVSRFTYAYALALNGNGQSAEAIRVLSSALARHPNDRDILFALAAFERDAGQLAAARRHAALLAEKYPDDREARALHESLRERRE